MASLVNLKRRIRVAGNIAKTTRAMQMVAASKMVRAKDGALKGRPYEEKLTSLVKNLVRRVPEGTVHPFLAEGSGPKLLLVFSADKGLCGSLIANVTREFLAFEDLKTTHFVTIGKRFERVLLKSGVGKDQVVASFPLGIAKPTFEQVIPLTKIVVDCFLNNEFSKVQILYARFISLFQQIPTVEKLLPIVIAKEEETTAEYLFEPSVREILESILPHFLESKLYQVLLEAYASEQAARMLAMQNATENATEIIQSLTLEYNKARQERITNEVLDIGRASLALSFV